MASAEEKAHRLLIEGRLTIEKVVDGLIIARCRGYSDGEVYTLGYRPDEKRWGCTCPGNRDFHRVCAHLRALQLVVLKPRD